jgi:hypothetical protein
VACRQANQKQRICVVDFQDLRKRSGSVAWVRLVAFWEKEIDESTKRRRGVVQAPQYRLRAKEVEAVLGESARLVEAETPNLCTDRNPLGIDAADTDLL